MIPIILILIRAIAIAIIIDKPWDAEDCAMDVLLGLMCGNVVVLLYFAIQVRANIVDPVEQPVQYAPLVNITDTSYADTHGTIRGSMLYVYGSISTDNKQVFNYYVKQSDGSFKLKSSPASDSTIIYTKDNPRVEISTYRCERGNTIFEAWSIASCEEKPTTYKFYLPYGSIVESYRLGGEE